MEQKKLSPEEFVVRAIRKLRRPPYKGIHTVFSGFNQAFREYFNTDPIAETNKLSQAGKIVIRPVKGGVMLYLAEDAQQRPQSADVLNDILGNDK